jgi:hypothetical protein
MFKTGGGPHVAGFSLGKGKMGTFLTVASVLLAIGVGLYVLLTAAASFKSAGVKRRWAGALGTREQIFERYPAADADAAARELQRLSAEVGIDISPRTDDDAPHPDSDGIAAFRRAGRPMAEYRKVVLERPYRGAHPPPPLVAGFLETRADELAAVRRHLIESGVPRWEMHLERGAQAPIPNLLGHINLQKLLITDALAAVAQGDRARALSDLDAAWSLTMSLADSPILISQMIAVADVRLVAGALRQIDDVPVGWRDRLSQHDLRRSVTTALKYEGWYWTQLDDPGDLTSLTGVASKLVRSVVAPYVRYCLADISDEYRKRLANLERLRAICDYDLAARGADLNVPVPRWNLIAGIMTPTLDGTLRRLARVELDLELTSKLIELDLARRENGGEWPPVLPGIQDSVACPRDGWVYEVSPAGAMTLAFNREVIWPDTRGLKLPARFTATR